MEEEQAVEAPVPVGDGGAMGGSTAGAPVPAAVVLGGRREAESEREEELAGRVGRRRMPRARPRTASGGAGLQAS